MCLRGDSVRKMKKNLSCERKISESIKEYIGQGNMYSCTKNGLSIRALLQCFAAGTQKKNYAGGGTMSGFRNIDVDGGTSMDH